MKLKLDHEYETLIQRKIDSGRFASTVAVVEEALREMNKRDEQLKLLRAAIAAGEASKAGKPVDPDVRPLVVDRLDDASIQIERVIHARMDRGSIF